MRKTKSCAVLEKRVVAEAVFTPAVIAAAADAKAKRVRLENLAFIMVSLKKIAVIKRIIILKYF